MTNIMSEKIDELSAALSKAQSQIENVGKDKQGYGYKYADLASCLEAVKIPLSSNGLALSQILSYDGEKRLVVTLLMHSSGQWIKSEFLLVDVALKQGNLMQNLGAGITYARRYALSSILGLAQEDDDGRAPTKQTEALQSGETIKQFLDLCKAHSLPLKDFATFAGVDSAKLDTVKSAIENFNSLKDAFKEIEDAANQ